MIDFRPVGYVLGLLLLALGVSMLVPMGADILAGNGHWTAMAQSAVMTAMSGLFLVLACAASRRGGLSLQETFLMTTGVWMVLPVFAAMPFVFGATQSSIVDGLFEAMSGMTTTGSTVLTGLDALPVGLNLWRGMMQWFGGIGIIIVAMVFLPELRVGGMQIFRSEGFDTMGKILPRAAEIASRISVIYFALTVMCALAYAGLGMPGFDAIMHAMTTISTGGFSNHDASFAVFKGPTEYVAALFMILASLPFVRFVQLMAGSAQPILRDSQIRVYVLLIVLVALIMAVFRVWDGQAGFEQALREGLFNVTSIISGTGYASADYQLWGGAAVAAFFFIGLIGGCAGSTSCSIKVFRYQLLFASISTQIRRLYAPHGIFEPRYQGRPVAADVMNAVMAFFMLFFVSLGVFSVLLALTGLDFTTAVSGAATALANVGPGLGDVIGPFGGEGFGALNAGAKWLLIAAMFIGRLELVVVFVLFSVRFWKD